MARVNCYSWAPAASIRNTRYIECIEKSLGKQAQKNLLPLQAGDVPDTFADVEDLVQDVGYKPATPVEEGVRRFIEWYLGYYGK